MTDQINDLNLQDLNLVDTFNYSYNLSEVDILKLRINNLETTVDEIRCILNEAVKTSGITKETIALIKKSLGLTFFINSEDADLETNLGKTQELQAEQIKELSERLSKLEEG
jgi:hypothetical protein